MVCSEWLRVSYVTPGSSVQMVHHITSLTILVLLMGVLDISSLCLCLVIGLFTLMSRAVDIEWLGKEAKGFNVGCDDNGDFIVVTDKVEYFSQKYDNFKEIISGLSSCCIEKFINGISLRMYNLIESYNDRFNFYIYDNNNGGFHTFDMFVRHCEINKKYYIGNTFDYHY
jgi:hypothetical protein